MVDRISPRAFHTAPGTEDWRVLYGRAFAHFPTPDFAAGAAFVAEIAVLADAAGHHPDITLRYRGVTIVLTTHDAGGLSQRDVDLARQISATAQSRGLVADPSATQQVNLTIDALVRAEVMPFWRAVLGYRDDGDEDLVDPQDRGPSVWFQHMEEPRVGRNRLHVDVAVPHEQAEARVAAALAAGGRLVSDEHAPSWWVLADAEGNEACIATWVGRWWEETDAVVT